VVRFDCDKATGKSAILIYGNHVKPQNKKYFAFPEMKIRLHRMHPVPTRGATEAKEPFSGEITL
jgi:hypothetical protein